jgi:hypothetical protein
MLPLLCSPVRSNVMPSTKCYWVIVLVCMPALPGCSNSEPKLDPTTMIDISPSDKSLSDEDFVDKFSVIAFKQLDKVDDNPMKLAEPYKTFVLVYNAQGVIDNGGFKYFFENDWPTQTPYSEFADAYQRIGRTEAASALRAAAASFGMDRPEKQCDARREYMDQHYDADKYEITGWNDCVCGDEQVWTDLAKWARSQLASKL